MKTAISVTGTYTGDAPRIFPDFAYRKAIPTELTVRNIDPARLNFMHEYPRSTELVMPKFREVTVIDWRLNYGPEEDDGTRMLTVELLSNQYTKSPKDRVIFAMRAQAHPQCLDFDGYTHAVVRKAFVTWYH